MHVYTLFSLYSTSHTLSPHPPTTPQYQHPRQDLFCHTVLQF
jgi:hypothetical protein